MKKNVLLTLVSLLVFCGSAWGADCLLLNEQTEYNLSLGNSHIYEFSTKAPGKTFSIGMYKTAGALLPAVGPVYLYESADKNNWTKFKEIEVGDLSKTYKTFSCDISESARYIKVDFPVGSYKRYFKNAIVVQSKFLRVDKTSIDFGSLLFNQQSEQIVKVSYSATSGTVTSNNSAFIVSSSTAGNADCGKYGDQNITITFKPTTTGDFSGTINIGGNNVTVQGKCIPPAPTLSNTAKGYTTASLSWNSVSGATGYRLYNNGSKFGEDMASTQTSIDLTGLAMHTTYKFTITALSGSVESNPSNEVAFTTNDLAASASITVSNASYTSVDAEWSAIADATGYYIVSNNGVVNVFEGDVTSGTLVGLMPKNTYTFTVYGMYGDEVSLNGTTSGEIKTLETKCDVESATVGHLGTTGLTPGSWDKKSYDITITKNQATINFSYAVTQSVLASGVKFTIEEKINNAWVECWSSSSKNGTAIVQLKRDTRNVRFSYSGNYGADYTNVSVMQGSYLEVPETTLDLGNVVKGETATGIVNVDFSAMAGDVTVKDNNPSFSVSPDKVGAYGEDGCACDTEAVTVTFNASKAGANEAEITIGGNKVKVTAMVTIAKPVISVAEVGYQVVTLKWDAIQGADGYIINCSDGKSDTQKVVEAKDFIGSYNYEGLLQNTEYKFTVKAYSGDVKTDPSNEVIANTLAFLPPAIEASNVGYDRVTLNITPAADIDADHFELVNEALNVDVMIPATAQSITVDTLALHTEYTYIIYAVLPDGTRSDNSNSVKFTTRDLGVTNSFVLSNISYNSAVATWEPVTDATGYAIKNENTGMYIYYGADVTSTTIHGLYADTQYKFTLYATYTTETFANQTAVNGREATGHTLKSDCPDQIFSKITLGSDCSIIESCAWNWDVKTATIHTEKNAPILHLQFERKSTSTDDSKVSKPNFEVYQSTDGVNFTQIYTTKNQSGTLKLESTDRNVRWFKFTFNGNFYCNIDGISVTEGMYLELDKESIDFGTVKVGQSVAAATVKVNFSAMKADVASGDAERFQTSKNIVGDGECGYGVEEFNVTVNTNVEHGTYNSNITVGSQNIPVKVVIGKLPAPKVTAAATGKSTVNVQWNKVENATGYKLTCAATGKDVIIPDDGSEQYSYDVTELEECTEYTFTVTTMYNASENESADASARTYSTIKIEAAGDAIGSTSWALKCVEGRWNEAENSFEVGSLVEITAYNSDTNVVFDKIQYYGGESTTNPTTIPVLDCSVTQTWAGVYYKYSGVAKTDDGEIFQTLNDAVEYSKTHAVSEITLLTDRISENLDVTSGSNITINGQGFKIGNVTVESDAKLTTSGTLIVGDLNIKTEYRNSGEVDPKDDKLQVTGKASFDKILDPSGKVNSNNWYAVCVPFDVNVSDIRGLDADGNEHVMVWDKDYIVDEYNGTKRAATGKGWFDLSANSVLTPGKMYIVAAIKYNTWRFYKTAGSPIVSNLTSITLNEFESSNIKNQGWNAIGNSQIFHVDLSTETEFGQVLVNGKKTYDIVRLSEESFAVAAPLFIQYASGSKDVNLSMKSHGSLRSVSYDNETFNLRIAGSNSTEHADQLFLTASEYALADYVIGRDLVKMGDLTGVSDARIWMKAKSANLCVMDAKLTDGVTVIPLGIYVPKSGNYDFYLNSFADGVKLELLYNGEIIHNFADGSFSTAMAKGTNDGYSLKVSVDADAPVITDVDEVDGVKAYIAENILYIKGMAEGTEYTVNTLQNKIAHGVADGGVEQVVLPAQGVYIVVSGDTTIKLLNK